MNPQCRNTEINDKLLLYFEKVLSDREREAVELHLQECDACSTDLQHLYKMHTVLRTHRQALSVKTATPACIAPELLIAYAGQGHTISPVETSRIREHLAGCAACTEEYEHLIILQAEIRKQPLEGIAVHGEQDFLEMVSRQLPLRKVIKRDFADRAAAYVQKLVERCRQWAADIFTPQLTPVYVRNGKRKFRENITVIKESSRGITVKIEIEELGGNMVELLVFFTDTRRKGAIDGLRASLIAGGKEVVSLFIEKGRAAFRDIPHGAYELVISRNGHEIKRVRFTTK